MFKIRASILKKEIEEYLNNINEMTKNNQTSYNNIEKNKIVLTGSTGFLGIHILKELIESNSKKKYDIYLMIRSDSIKEAKLKLINTWNKYIHNKEIKKLDLNFINKNLNIVLGDISKKNWNCDLPENSILIHSAGIVNTLATKELLKDNYMSIINIAEQIIYKNVYFLFISTLSVYVSTNFNGIAKEESIDDDLEFYGGYSQSKFIAEKLVELFPNFKIIRPSLLTASTFNNKFPENDYFKIFVNALKKINKKPIINNESFFNFVPVDLSAKIILEELKKIDNKKIIHIANKNKSSINEILSLLDFQELEIEEFLKEIKKLNLIEQKLLINSLNINNSLIIQNNVNKYFNINVFQGNINFECKEEIDNSKYITEYLKNILN